MEVASEHVDPLYPLSSDQGAGRIWEATPHLPENTLGSQGRSSSPLSPILRRAYAPGQKFLIHAWIEWAERIEQIHGLLEGHGLKVNVHTRTDNLSETLQAFLTQKYRLAEAQSGLGAPQVPQVETLEGDAGSLQPQRIPRVFHNNHAADEGITTVEQHCGDPFDSVDNKPGRSGYCRLENGPLRFVGGKGVVRHEQYVGPYGWQPGLEDLPVY